MTRAFYLIELLLLLAGCRTPRPSAVGADSSGATLRADSAQFTVHTNGSFYQASIGFHFANHSGRALSMNYCNVPTPPLLEKQRADGSWMLAYEQVLQLCQTLPPFRIPDGGTYQDTLRFAAGRPQTAVFPKFEPDSVPGIYRLRWVLRAGVDPDNKAAPFVTIVSPSFTLTVR